MTTYEYIFSLQDKFTATMNRINRVQDKASSKFQGLRNKVGQFGAKFKEAFMQIPGFSNALNLIGNPFVLLTAGIIGVTTLLGNATTKAAAFNHEFLQLRNLNLDKSKEQINDLNDSILNLSITEGLDPTGTSKAFYDIQSATGLYGKEVEDITRTVGRFSIATGADLGNSVNSTTKAMKAFGLGSKDIQGLLESNAKTVQVGITNFDDLAKVQTEYAGAAAAAGQKVDTANKLFAGFTMVAKDSQTAATLTKTAFQGLTQKKTIDGLKGIGVSLFDAQGQMRDMDGVIRELTPKLQSMSDQDFANLSNEIGGPEGLRMLFNQLKTSGDDVIGMLDAFDRSEFNIEQALKNAKGDFTTLKNIVGNQLNTAMTMLGQQILPPLIRGLAWISDTIKNMVGFFRDNSEAIKFWGQTFLIAFSPIIAGLTFAALKFTIMGVAAGLAAAKTAIFTAAQWALNTAMLANPIGAIIVGVAALIALVVAVIRKYDEWGAAVTLAMGPLGAIINIVQSFRRNWEDVKSSFTDGGIIAGLKKIGAVILDALLMPIQQLLELVAKIPGLEKIGNSGADYINDLRRKLDVNAEERLTDAQKNGREYFNLSDAQKDGRNAFESTFDTPKSPAPAATGSLFTTEGERETITDPNTETFDSITGGGPKSTVFNISIGKLNENITISTNKLDEGVGEIEDKMLELLLRVVNGANYAAG